MIALPKGLFRYMVMPEIGIRLHRLFMGGFGYIPYFLAVVYQMVGLLPARHPYLYSENIGRFGIRHVVFEAARNLKFGWRNIDQYILFFAVMAGLLIFVMQLLALIAVFVLQPAAAMPTNWTGFFYVSNPAFRSQDLAYMMLDMVFGVEHPSIANSGFFESCIGTATPCEDNFGSPVYEWQAPAGAVTSDMNTAIMPVTLNSSLFGPMSSSSHTYFPFPYHLGLHRIFQIYSNGLLVIGVVIASYFIATVLAETMQSGVAFGRRFNKTWAPLRIVIAFGLLMPMTSGLNSSQYLVLYAAKYGSAFASNGWRYFNGVLSSGYYGSDMRLVSHPNEPKLDTWTHFMFVAKVCKRAHDFYEINAFNSGGAVGTPRYVGMYVLLDSASAPADIMITAQDYATVISQMDDHIDTMVIRFGVRDADRFPNERSNIGPVCGELHLPLADTRDAADAAPGPYLMQEGYFNLIRDIWWTTRPNVGTPPETNSGNRRHINLVTHYVSGAKPLPSDPDPDMSNEYLLTSEYVEEFNEAVSQEVNTIINSAVTAQETAAALWGDPSNATSPLFQKGWAGAGIWYNKISEMNGSLVASVASVPVVSRFPEVMERVWELKAKYDKDIPPGRQFEPEVNNVDSTKSLLDGVYSYEFARALWIAYSQWGTATGGDSERSGDNPILSAISTILGVDGLYNLRENPTTHPLAMLSGVGRSLVESAIRSLTYAAVISGVSAIGGKYVPKTLANISASFFVTIAMMGLTVGFVLFYVLPFLPFIYFFFAVGGWIKGIFEAMVGAPLWALAHIRIDGHGLSGQAALNGYYLIFEVFLRPMLILFGLLASISIYSALVAVLNTSFSMAVANLGGFSLETALSDPTVLSLDQMRGLVDEFFYTVMYAIIVYLLGMSSFKLIDTIPNNILRWMGQSVATFGDQRENPAEGLASKVSVGSQQATSKIGGGLQSMVSAANKV